MNRNPPDRKTVGATPLALTAKEEMTITSVHC